MANARRAAALIAVIAGASCSHPAAAPPASAPSNRAVHSPAPELGAHRCAATLVQVGDEADGRWTEGVFIDPPAEADLACNEYRDQCKATFPITVVNCRAEPITVQSQLPSIELDEPWIETTAAFPHVVEPGATWTIEATACGQGTTRARFWVQTSIDRVLTTYHPGHPDHGRQTRTPQRMVTDMESASIRIANPARDRDFAACQACNGDWGLQGMMHSRDACPGSDDGESCVCRSTDGGTACDDGDDCQGWCDAEQFVVDDTRGSPAVAYGHWVGHCSEFVDQRGCASPIPSGASHRPPAVQSINTSCVD